MSLGEVGGVGGNLVGHDACAHVVAVRQGEVFLRRHVAEHGRAEGTDDGGTDGRRDVVVAGCDVRDERAEGVEGSLVALLDLALHVLGNLVHGHVARALDEGLHALGPGSGNEFAHRVEFGKLRRIVRIVDGTRSEAVAERDGHVVLGAEVADVVEVFVEEALAVVLEAPFGNDAAAAAHHARHAALREVDVLAADAAVDGEVVHALLTLLHERIAEEFPGEVLRHAAHLLHGLVHRHRAYGDGTVAHNPFARLVDVVARGEVHQRVAAPLAAPDRFLHLLLDGGGGGAVADVRVYFHEEVAADNHRFRLGVVDVGGDDGASGGHLVAHELRRDVRVDAELSAVHVFADGHVFHFGGHDALLGQRHLRDFRPGQGAQRQVVVGESQVVERGVGESCAAVGRGKFGQQLHAPALPYPRLAEARQTLLQVNLGLRVGVGAARVVHHDGSIL